MRTKTECRPVGSGSESDKSSLLVSSRHGKGRFERAMVKEVKDDAWKRKKKLKKKVGGKLRGKFLYTFWARGIGNKIV
jgi:hypothetical protein